VPNKHRKQDKTDLDTFDCLNSNLRIGLLTENLQQELQDGLQALEQLVANLIQKQGFQISKQAAS
jgi:hypothetical protein